MYNPTHFAENDQALLFELMRQHPLACIVMQRDGMLEANHIPLILRTKPDGSVVLVGHVARPNPIAKCEQVENCLVIFQASEHYISPAWYAAKKETGKVVPTWNYSVVHVQGKFQVVDDVLWLRTLLEELTDVHEAVMPQPWQVSDAPDAFLQATMRGIVGIEISIEKLIGKRKLSQNKSSEDRANMVAGLQALAPTLATESQQAQARQMAQEIASLQEPQK